MDVVGGHQGRAGPGRQADQVPVAGGITLQEILLEFHEHRVLTEPVQVVPQQAQGLGAAVFHQQPVNRATPAAGE